MVKRFYGIFLVLFMVVFFTACRDNQANSYFESTGFVMDTVLIQRLYGENSAEVAVQIETFLHQLEKQLSAYIEGSTVQQINAQAGIKPVTLTEDILPILQKAKAFSQEAPDIFNITAGPLISLWQIGKEGFRVPTEQQISDALSLVEIEDFVLEEESKQAFLRKKGQSIDLGGIAKGIACDEIKKQYTQYGIEYGVISLGGNLILLNGKPDGNDFEVGIRNPFGSASDLFATYRGRNVMISTSGGYERYSTQDGKTYSHVLDLRTGYPVENDLAGVTVICLEGAFGDYLSTYIYIQGLEQGKKMLTDERFGLILVDREKQVYVSPHIQSAVKIIDAQFQLCSVLPENSQGPEMR